MIDTTETAMVVRVLASAHDGPTSWDLQCDVREALVTWLRENHPESLPRHRLAVVDGEHATGRELARVS